MKKRVIIAGSRDFNDYEFLEKLCDSVFRNLNREDIIIISGHANGADKLGELYSKNRNLGLEIYPANWEKYGRSAGYIRNTEMANVGDCLLAIRNQGSLNKGTDMMIRIAKSKGLDIRVVNYGRVDESNGAQENN